MSQNRKKSAANTATTDVPTENKGTLTRTSANDPTINALLIATGGRTSLGRTSSTGTALPASDSRIFNDESSVGSGGSAAAGGSRAAGRGTVEDDHI